MRQKSKISDTEKTIFRDMMKKVKPLTQTKTPPSPTKITPRKHIPIIESELNDADELPPVMGSDYLQFARSGVQPRLFRKLKTGQYPIEAILDLHGKTTAEAKEALEPFLWNCQQHHIRCVLIIHGKGQQSKTPVLKNRLNHWLRQSKFVIAFCTAKIKHGSTGALYVLLKA